jgi:3-oxoacyl-[acyl-carrier protein] reductase
MVHGDRRQPLLPPEVIVPPLSWLASERSDGIAGARFDATRWRADLPASDAAAAVRDDAGWPGW